MKPTTEKTPESLMRSQIDAGNEQIGRFTGFSAGISTISDYPVGKLTNYYKRKLRYHKSWDKLMIAVDKIEAIGYKVYIIKGPGVMHYCSIKKDRKNHIDTFSTKCKILAVWKAVVEFITLNKQPA